MNTELTLIPNLVITTNKITIRSAWRSAPNCNFHQLGVQAIGVLAIGAWAIVTSFIVLYILKKTIGLRVSKEEEVDGLDIHEHKTNVYNYKLTQKI